MKQLQLCLFVFLLDASNVFAQFKTRLFDIHTDLMNTKVEYAGSKNTVFQYGLGANVYTGGQHIGGMLEYNFHQVKLSKFNIPNVKQTFFHELYLGIRYYPMRPTFLLGNMAVRLTAAACGGFDLQPNWRAMLMAGFVFSPILNTSGLVVNVIYRPGTHTINGYVLQPTWAIRLGIAIGASATSKK